MIESQSIIDYQPNTEINSKQKKNKENIIESINDNLNFIKDEGTVIIDNETDKIYESLLDEWNIKNKEIIEINIKCEQLKKEISVILNKLNKLHKLNDISNELNTSDSDSYSDISEKSDIYKFKPKNKKNNNNKIKL